MNKTLYAHTPKNGGDRWQPLSEHLLNVAKLSAEFASKFNCRELGYIVGLFHDIGKASDEFQRYLINSYNGKSAGSVDHKTLGAVEVAKIYEPLAFPVLGHHGGIPNRVDVNSAIRRRLDENKYNITEIVGDIEIPEPEAPSWAVGELCCEFFIRMLYSALVDADALDTEQFWNPEKHMSRGGYEGIPALWDMFKHAYDRMFGSVEQTPVNVARAEIYSACISAADRQQGIFKLTVPTGGGKTLSGMGFALKHAVEHRLDRVIVAIPYTSIIDQNANTYRQIFGDNMIEHHSAVELNDGGPASAAENWDAPIIVTTTVQLFESLFSNRPSKCRKLHNIANSVIILDEVQTLPVGLIQPILDILKELVKNYGVTLVLSTATQPALENSPYVSGFDGEVEEIVPEPHRYFNQLKRVDYRVEPAKWDWDRAAEEMMKRHQVLCVVNSRKDALDLFNKLGSSNALHLSALMCPVHRIKVINEIKRRLGAGEVCRVVSTQVVEAGVDLDFPCVLRAMGPLDRIVQAAGRCNREGKLEQPGEAVVFEPLEEHLPMGSYRTAMSIARSILQFAMGGLNSPDVFRRYFNKLWMSCATDSRKIPGIRRTFNYPKVAEEFKMIQDNTVSVVVRYTDEPIRMTDSIAAKNFVSRREMRKLQPYSVNLYGKEFDFGVSSGQIRKIIDGVYLWEGEYSNEYGLSIDMVDPSDLIV